MKKILRKSFIYDFWAVLSSNPEVRPEFKLQNHIVHKRSGVTVGNLRSIFAGSGFAVR